MPGRRKQVSNNIDDSFRALYTNIQQVVERLMGSSPSVNVRNSKGQTLLHQAVNNEDIDRIQQFSSAGVCMNALDRDGESPLHAAIRQGSVSMVTALLAAGANPDLELISAIDMPITPLQLSVLYGREDLVRVLLTAGADMDSPSCLHTAVGEDDDVMAQRLLTLGANVNALNESGLTPLAHAVTRDCVEVVSVLLQWQPRLEQRTYQLPLLVLAAQCPENIRGRMFQMLLSAGVDSDCVLTLPLLVKTADTGTCLMPVCSNAIYTRINCLRWLLEYNCTMQWPSGTHSAKHCPHTELALTGTLDRNHDSALYYPLRLARDSDWVAILMLLQAGLDVAKLNQSSPTKYWLKLRSRENNTLGRYLSRQLATPKPLREMSRNALRCAIGTNIQKKVEHVCLPETLKQYVLLQGVFSDNY